MNDIIKIKKSIIPACDVPDLKTLGRLVRETCNVKGIGGYKIGFELVIPFGMGKVIETIRKHTDLPVIYDHQKAGTDVPFTGEKFARACKGIDAVILFPQAGPETAKAWIKACLKEGLGVIVGGEMTHPAYLSADGGFLLDDTPRKIYSLAADLGIHDFVVPGNKPQKITEYRKFFEGRGIRPIFYSPGLVAQGGEITESAKAAGDRWHAIIGRGIYEASDMGKAAEEFASSL